MKIHFDFNVDQFLSDIGNLNLEEKLLQETIGNPNCRVVVSMKRAVSNSKPICLRRIILHNPETKTYCVMIYNENEKNLRLVSWNNAEENYGNNEWSLR